jgi:hypothetical protein
MQDSVPQAQSGPGFDLLLEGVFDEPLHVFFAVSLYEDAALDHAAFP